MTAATPTAMIRDLGAMLAPEAPFKARLPMLHRAISAHLPDGLSVSRRTIRAIHNNETDKIDYRIRDAIAAALADQEARREYREFQKATNRLAAALAVAGAPFSGDQLAAIRRLEIGQASDPRADHQGNRREARGMAGAGIGYGGGRI